MRLSLVALQVSWKRTWRCVAKAKLIVEFHDRRCWRRFILRLGSGGCCFRMGRNLLFEEMRKIDMREMERNVIQTDLSEELKLTLKGTRIRCRFSVHSSPRGRSWRGVSSVDSAMPYDFDQADRLAEAI